jgi:hypothetical protein
VYEFTPSTQVPPFAHGVEVHSLMSVVQVAPEYPGAQLHVYELVPSMQVAPLAQGVDAHSFMLVAQVVPA